MRSTLALALTLTFGCADTGEDADICQYESCDRLDTVDSRVAVLESYDVSEFNSEIDPAQPTVDLAFYLSEGGPAGWSFFASSIHRAQEIFGEHGLQIRVQSALRIEIPEEWQTQEPWLLEVPSTPEYLETNLYANMEEEQARLAPSSEDHYSAILSHFPEGELAIPGSHTIHVVTLSDVPLSYYEYDDDGWSLEQVPTGALSFPPYSLAGRIPESLRGFISVSSNPRFAGTRMLSHELGHKLINVSHEGVGVCPGFEVDGDGLMLYGDTEEIPSGPDGRYHAERLALTPFAYRVVDGLAVFDTEFEDGGIYTDGLYDGLYVDPPCQ